MSRVTESDLDLHELDYLNQQSSFNFIEQLFSKKKKILLCPVVDNRNEKINLISKKLKSIQRKEKLIYEERGAKDLYIAWPFVKGKLQDDTIIRCPLVYIPVSLVENNDNWILEARNEVAVTFNKSFLLAYSFFNKRKLDDDFIETTLEDFFEDSQSFRVQLYELLKNSPVDVNFNQELFENKLSSFEYLNKNKCDEIFATGVLKLYPEAVLGLFPQSGSFLIPDYEAINSKLSFENFEQFFLDKTNVHSNHSFSEKNFKIKEEQTFTPFALDASQEEVIVNIKLGNSLVVQGPPGTGKSQKDI